VGAQRQKGEPGPTSAGVGGVNTTIVSAGTPLDGMTSASVTLDQPGKVLVLVTGTFSLLCGPVDCQRVISAQVGGTSVPRPVREHKALTGEQATQAISAAGIRTNVPAGTHEVQIAHQIIGPSISTGTRGDVRIVTLALG
jgi:hypothetical protein